jgi:(4-(4-[2-(gamma-L-glutamylamino)ethyl]phenoxymethyl)furan-2-yl)methanamine synthase
MPVSVLGLDIGGANLKAAHADGFATQRPFALWKHPERLIDQLSALVAQAPPFDRLAVTMTGELCDCYETKRQGVNAILDAVASVAGEKPVRVWSAEGTFVDPATAREEWLSVAAANWLASAAYAGRFVPDGSALFVDCGSTTTDVVPLWNGRPNPFGLTDVDRLRTRELVYTGARRTPVCALLGADGMAELFATTLDVYLILGRIAEDAADCDTPDGRPATKPLAHARLARMIGGDADMTSEADTRHLAELIAARQAELIRAACRDVASRIPDRPAVIVTAGSGEFLADAIVDSEHGWRDVTTLSLTRRLGPEISRAAAAFAVAVLATEPCA